jgi:hypothetical protein
MSADGTGFDPGFDWTFAVVKVGTGGALFEVDSLVFLEDIEISVEGEWTAPGVPQATVRQAGHLIFFDFDEPFFAIEVDA